MILICERIFVFFVHIIVNAYQSKLINNSDDNSKLRNATAMRTTFSIISRGNICLDFIAFFFCSLVGSGGGGGSGTKLFLCFILAVFFFFLHNSLVEVVWAEDYYLSRMQTHSTMRSAADSEAKRKKEKNKIWITTHITHITHSPLEWRDYICLPYLRGGTYSHTHTQITQRLHFTFFCFNNFYLQFQASFFLSFFCCCGRWKMKEKIDIEKIACVRCSYHN